MKTLLQNFGDSANLSLVLEGFNLIELFFCLGNERSSDQLWEQMSDIEKLNRLKDLQRRIFFEIQNKGNIVIKGRLSNGCYLTLDVDQWNCIQLQADDALGFSR